MKFTNFTTGASICSPSRAAFLTGAYPHTPFKAGPKFRGSSKDGMRGDIMQEMDWGVGEIMKALKEAGIAENTIFIFTSDNGATSNKYCKPFKGTKYVTLEDGHRVPFIINWPAKIKEGRVIDTKVAAMDLFPTLSEIIGERLPMDRIYDGVSLVPLIDGGKIKRPETEPFYYYNSENLQAIRVGDWKLHLPREAKQAPFWDRSSLFKNLAKPILYNVTEDMGETKDVAGEHPEVVDKLMKLIRKHQGKPCFQLGKILRELENNRPTLPCTTLLDLCHDD